MTAPSPEAPTQGTETSPTTEQKVLKAVKSFARIVAPDIIFDAKQIDNAQLPDAQVMTDLFQVLGGMISIMGAPHAAEVGLGIYAGSKLLHKGLELIQKN